MKKLTALLLVLPMLCALALAETDYLSMPEEDFVFYSADMGLALTGYPEVSDMPMGYDAKLYKTDLLMGLCVMRADYIFEDEETGEAAYVRASECIIGMRGDITWEDAQNWIDLDSETWTEITRADGHNAFLHVYEASERDDAVSQAQQEVINQYAYLNEAYFKNFVNVPCTAAIIDRTSPLSFEATDLDGNAITAKELLARADYTLFNLWTTWCVNCVKEMADLQIVNDSVENVQVVLICNDVTAEDASALQDAKDILAENGVTLTCLMGSPEISSQMTQIVYPTSLLYGSDGMFIARHIGASYAEGFAYWLEDYIG